MIRFSLFLLLATVTYGQRFEMPMAVQASAVPLPATLPLTCDTNCQAAVQSIIAQLIKPSAPSPTPTATVAPVVASEVPPSSAIGVNNCPSYWAAGASYAPWASPKTTGFLAYATLLPGVKCAPGTAQPLMFSQNIITATRVGGVWSLAITTTTGVAYPAKALGKSELWLIGNVGASISGSTSTVSLGSAMGAILVIPAFKGNVRLAPGFEFVNFKPVGLLASVF